MAELIFRLIYKNGCVNMQQNNHEFESILTGFTAALREYGLSEQGIWTAYYRAFCSIRKFHYTKGVLIYDEAILSEFEQETIRRYNSKEISTGRYNILRLCCERLREYMTTGEVHWIRRATRSRIGLNDFHESILNGFLNSLEVKGTTLGDISWSTRKYLSFLESKGISINDISNDTLRQFFVYCSRVLSQNSIRNIQCYLRKFMLYLQNEGYSVRVDKLVLNAKLSYEKKVLPALTENEFNSIVQQINRHTVKGKRDYAMFILAATSGIRGVDIVNLRLSDIDWVNGIINIIQSKTKDPLTIPLTANAGEAIKEYILNARPNCGSDYVFITVRAPIKELKSSMSLNYLLRHYQKKAKIPQKAFDGKGFHAIRRMLGTNLVSSGVSAELTAQILGHKNTDNIRRYVSINISQLKECAVSFDHIQPLPGRWN